MEYLIFITVNIMLCIVGLKAYYTYALKNQIIDKPNERSSHTHTPVRGMGIMLLISLVTLWIFEPSLNYLVLGAAVAAIIGYIDDRQGMKRRWRLMLYLVALILALLNLPINISSGWVYLIPSGFLALGIINAYNFMDGINGITGLYSLVLVISIGTINIALLHEQALGYLSLSIGIFCLIFGYYNYRKTALAFLGDSGSVALGVLATFLVVYAGLVFEDWKVVLLLSVYGVDALGTVLFRSLKKENIFEAHRSHIYQDLVHKSGWSHLKVALTYALVQLAINAWVFLELYQGQLSLFSFITILSVLILTYVFIKKSLGQLKFKKNT